MQKNLIASLRPDFIHKGWGQRLFLLCLSGLLVACGNSSSESEAPFLSGTITMEQGTRVDQDAAIAILRQGLADNPQSPVLPADVLLGGFVSHKAGSYDADFGYPKDQKDSLLLPLSAGQSVRIRLFNSLNNEPIDVHTRLFLNDVEVDREEGASDTSRLLMAERDGEHRLEITVPNAGHPVRYLISSAPESSSNALSLLETDFVLGEAVITLAPPEPGLLSIASMPASAAHSRSLGGRHHRVSMPDSFQPLNESTLSAQMASVPDKAATLEWIRQLQEDPAIESASPNYRVRAMADPTLQTNYEQQRWHYQLAGLESAWNDGFSGQGIRVAVLDTGVYSPDKGGSWHQELNPNIDCTIQFNENCFNAIDPGSPPVDEGVQTENGVLYHGTHVTGTVGADVSTEASQFTGVAFDSLLIPVKVLEGEEGTLADVVAGVQWVVNNGNPRADIINLSLGASGNSSALEQSLIEARQAGILVTAAAGNEASRRKIFPAAYDSVLSVGAVNCNGTRSRFSNFGFSLDLVAPGGGPGIDCGDNDSFVWSADVVGDNETIGGLPGTSMASPHVAGILALLLERANLSQRRLLPPIVDALVREQRLLSAQNQPFDVQRGYGLVDASQLSGLGDISRLSVLEPDPRRVVFPEGESEQRLMLSAKGKNPETVTNVRVVDANDDPWLEVVGNNPDGSFQIRINRDFLPASEGNVRGDLRVNYVDNEGVQRSFLLPVTVLRPSDEDQRNAGTHFVQLIPVDDQGERTGGEVIEQAVEARDGRYSFSFDPTEIPPGDYLLLAGSDLDNNGFFCDAGEACARFPRTEEPRPITITPETRRTVTFSTSYRLPTRTFTEPQRRRSN